MPIIKAYLLPHSPLLIPEIGRANHAFLDKTILAYNRIKEDINNEKIETLIILSPHINLGSTGFLINCAPEMSIDFQDFGFIPPKTIFKGDVPLADQIKNALKDEAPMQMLSETVLDYGSGVPLYLLKDQGRNAKILIISPAEDLELSAHFELGKKLSNILEKSDKRIAIIASGDLSHRLKRKSPGGYSPKGPKFDNKLIEHLSNATSATENILKLDKKLITDASECGLKPIVISLGLINHRTWEANILAYQTDFGVGYLSLEFLLKD